ncbi:hypothetical protein lerEdw1_004720 [Lerista edwardsae]|nr:hypothetical protein lerEdw1_004723 [Lerista edwardsae]KAJ6650710.1 hypothetical protein lerEdw1_004720 [Lerista edwardsae]
MEPTMEYCLTQVLQKDVGKRLQVGQELIDYFSDKHKSADLEHDQTMLDKMVDGLATSWVNSSNYKGHQMLPLKDSPLCMRILQNMGDVTLIRHHSLKDW